MTPPLIFLAFANDQDRHLEQLKEESRRLFQALEENDRKGYIKIHREESASVEDISRVLTRYPNQIAIFHYAGHAGGNSLHLEEGEAISQGLAQLLGEQAELQLVFLNGCSTRGQVQALMNAGVKAVIATSVPVADSRAMAFAHQFYDGLAHSRSLAQAFQLAEAYVKTKFEQAPVWANSRSLVFEDEEDAAEENELPWGLYVNPSFEREVLDYRLPYYRKVGLPEDLRQYIDRSFEANRYIVEVLDEMCKYNPDIYHEMLRREGGKEVKKDSSEYPDIIMSHFPWPIGSQIRLLFQSETQAYGHPRLKQLLSLYLVASQVLYYGLLSEVWDALRKGTFTLPPNLSLSVPKSRDAFLNTDWLSQTLDLFVAMTQQGLQTYLGELKDFYSAWQDEESGLAEAHQELENLRKEVDSLPNSDLPELCLDTEYLVAMVLGKMAFLSRYRMLTVREIKLDEPRYQATSYEMDLGDLRLSSSGALSLYSDDEQRRKEASTNSQSILLAADEQKLNQALNLSPFVMDKNTFLHPGGNTQHPAHIFMLAWEESGRGHYLTYNLSIWDAVQSSAHQIHTGMTLDDFAEGRNVTRNKENSSPRSSLRARRAARTPIASPPAFSLMEKLLNMFQADIERPKSNIYHG